VLFLIGQLNQLAVRGLVGAVDLIRQRMIEQTCSILLLIFPLLLLIQEHLLSELREENSGNCAKNLHILRFN